MLFYNNSNYHVYCVLIKTCTNSIFVFFKLLQRPCCRCKKFCFEEFGEHSVAGMFSELCDIHSKSDKGIFLQGLIGVEDIKLRMPRVKTPRNNSNVVKYYLTVRTLQNEVSMKASLGVYWVTVTRLNQNSYSLTP